VVAFAEPSPKLQENVYGVVPPVTVAVKVTGLPTVGLALAVKLAARARGATLIVWVVVILARLASVTLS